MSIKKLAASHPYKYRAEIFGVAQYFNSKADAEKWIQAKKGKGDQRRIMPDIHGDYGRRNPIPAGGAEIMPVIDDDDESRPKIRWMVLWYDDQKRRQGRDFISLDAAKFWARSRWSRVEVRKLARKYRKFLKNGIINRYALHK